MRALAAVLALLTALGGATAGAAAAEPVAGDTRETAIVLTLGVPAEAGTAQAQRESGDPAGGHSIWFRYDPPAEGVVTFDLGGTDFDSVLGLAGTNPLGPFVTEDRDAPHPSIQVAVGFYLYGPTWLRVDGVTAQDVGTARVTARLSPAPEDDWARPVPLDLGATAVASANRIYARNELQPGEPGGAEDRLSVWFAFVARQTGSLALDACLLSTSPGREYLRVLDDRPLGQAAVLAEGLTAAEERRCVPLVLEVRAGERYRVQATPRNGPFSGYNGIVALRGRMLGTPPAVTELGLEYAAASESYTPLAEVVAAPGAELVRVECRVDGDEWAPCSPRAGGLWAGRTLVKPFPDRSSFAVRATDSAGRTATVRERYIFAIPTSAGTGAPPPPPPMRLQPAAPPLRALPLPRARFTVTSRGARVRSLTAPGLPVGAAVTVTCRGRGCPLRTRRRTSARAGTLALTPLLRRALLRPGARLAVAVAAPRHRSRTVTWTMRTRRSPRRTVSPLR